jgi:hypothetical protein
MKLAVSSNTENSGECHSLQTLHSATGANTKETCQRLRRSSVPRFVPVRVRETKFVDKK